MSNRWGLFAAVLFATSAQADMLPTWQGVWRGDCINSLPGNPPSLQYAMTLEIAPAKNPDALKWIITYALDTGKEVRNYELRTVKAENGHYVINERDGILIDTYLFDNALYSEFDLGNQRAPAKYEINGNEMHFEVPIYESSVVRATGHNANIVLSHQADSLQRCILNK